MTEAVYMIFKQPYETEIEREPRMVHEEHIGICTKGSSQGWYIAKGRKDRTPKERNKPWNQASGRMEPVLDGRLDMRKKRNRSAREEKYLRILVAAIIGTILGLYFMMDLGTGFFA